MSGSGTGEPERRAALGAIASSGRFAVTAEMPTVDTADPAAIASLVAPLLGHVDAISCTDNSGAHAHVSSVAVAKVLLDHGFEPIAQFACRDRNRLALQSDLLGASALGIRNICIMTGDDVTAGDHPDAKRVFDLDSTQLIRIASELRDGERYLSGRALSGSPSYTIGAVENPFAPPMEFRPARLAKKIEAGAEFVFTQIAFDLDVLGRFMAQVVDRTARARRHPGVGVRPGIGARGAVHPSRSRGTAFLTKSCAGWKGFPETVRRTRVFASRAT
ncbi:MAG: methylenetetrahydrofolate reductase [Actinomycetota bacterium]